jgi:predicted ATPase
LQTARAVAEQMLHLAQNQPDPILRVSAHQVLGSNLLFLCESGPAREQLEQGLMLCHSQNHLSYVLLEQDYKVACLANLAWELWVLGYPDQALQRSHEALTLSQALAHRYTQARTLSYVTALHLSRQDGQVAQQQAEALIRLATDQEFALQWALGTFFRGLALVRQGKLEGIDQMQRGLNAWQATGAELLNSYLLAGLAEGYANAGQTEQGLTLLAEALTMVDKTDERFWEAELHRLKGELLFMQYQGKESTPPVGFNEVEACFRRAIDVARRQQAKSLELRATASLCRLWQARGKRAEAHALLALIYEWFTEGLDLPDLLEARSLLESLG